MKNGDLIVSTVRTYLRAIAPIINPPSNLVVSTGFAVIRPRKKVISEFLTYSLQDDIFMNEVTARSIGVSYPAINANELMSIQVVVPPLPEQLAIADYLDRQTALIDQRLTTLAERKAVLAELRKATIHEAVTKGLNKAAAMKDSGVTWIGEIPQGWGVVRGKNLFRITKRIVGNQSDQFTLLSLTKQGIIKRDMENPQGKFPAEFDSYQVVRPGNFVFCLFDVEETPRTVELSTLHGMITGAYTVMECLRAKSTKYLYYQFLSFDDDKKLRPLYTGMRNTIPKEVFMGIHVAFPPLSEQLAISAYLDQQTAQIDAQLATLDEQSQVLKELRKAIIHEAVTGKIDLSGYTPPPQQALAA